MFRDKAALAALGYSSGGTPSPDEQAHYNCHEFSLRENLKQQSLGVPEPLYPE